MLATFCSLLLAEGRSVIYVARQAGNSPSMISATYGHVMDELEDAERVSAKDAIRAARDAQVSEKCPPGEAAEAG